MAGRPRTRDRDLFGRVVRVRQGHAEDAIQAAIVEYVRRCYPQVLIAAVPNGGLRSATEAAKFRWTGVLRGFPDLIVTFDGGGVAFWETKNPLTGKLSDDQLEILERLSSQGHVCSIVCSIDDARKELASLGLVGREVLP